MPSSPCVAREAHGRPRVTLPRARNTAVLNAFATQVGPNADLVKVTPKKLEITPGETFTFRLMLLRPQSAATTPREDESVCCQSGSVCFLDTRLTACFPLHFVPYCWVGAEMKAVAAQTIVWKDTVTLGTVDAPKKTCALYASDAVLWGTVSEEVRETPDQIYDYFVSP